MASSGLKLRRSSRAKSKPKSESEPKLSGTNEVENDENVNLNMNKPPRQGRANLKKKHVKPSAVGQDPRIGKMILKSFRGKDFEGLISAFHTVANMNNESDVENCYLIKYEDGDIEDIKEEKIDFYIGRYEKHRAGKGNKKRKRGQIKPEKTDESTKNTNQVMATKTKRKKSNGKVSKVKEQKIIENKSMNAKGCVSARETEELWKKSLIDGDHFGHTDEVSKTGRKKRESVSEYEKQRLARIQENAAVLETLGLDLEKNKISAFEQQSVKRRIQNTEKPKATRRPAQQRRPAPPRRSSRRLRGEKATLSLSEEELAKEAAAEVVEEFGVIKSCEEYWTERGVKPRLVLKEGHKFNAWVKEEVRKACNIAGNSTEAWESNGGGKFSFKNPTGNKRSKGGAGSAKEVARGMLRKNPNQYFYRHTAPGVEHWMGDWTEEENELFLEIAKKHGVGNKWGLFATFIPHRVGYQCSNYYRAYFVGTGIIWDPNFAFTKYGETVWKGGRGGS